MTRGIWHLIRLLLCLRAFFLHAKCLFFLLHHSAKLFIHGYSAGLKFLIVVLRKTPTEIYKQAENRICQHFGLILFHIIKYILRISVAPFSRKCEKLQRFFPILRNVVSLDEAMHTDNAMTNMADNAEQGFRTIQTFSSVCK